MLDHLQPIPAQNTRIFANVMKPVCERVLRVAQFKLLRNDLEQTYSAMIEKKVHH